MSEPGLPSNLPKNSTELSFTGQLTETLFLPKKFKVTIHAKLILDSAGSFYNILYVIIVPTPFVGGGTIYSNGFFCSEKFG